MLLFKQSLIMLFKLKLSVIAMINNFFFFFANQYPPTSCVACHYLGIVPIFVNHTNNCLQYFITLCLCISTFHLILSENEIFHISVFIEPITTSMRWLWWSNYEGQISKTSSICQMVTRKFVGGTIQYPLFVLHLYGCYTITNDEIYWLIQFCEITMNMQ